MALTTNKRELLANYPTCYACEAAKLSMEHAPPQCFFPDIRDASGNCLHRRDLIKVPSCHRHNSTKSGEDMYAAWHLAGLEGVNHCGDHVREEVLKKNALHDLSKRQGRFMKLLAREVYANDGSRILAKADPVRMVAFLELCARAVFFFETMRKLTLPLRVTNLSNNFLDEELNNELRERQRFFDGEIGDAPILGSNPEVFNYSIAEKEPGIVLVRMIFYGTQKQWVYHHPDAGPTEVNRRTPRHTI